ncbi:MAG: YbhB/YbcL family Raf kinase inhibitor-like protein [Pyrinomonadaceae bacterium MAG19_C2-C3]|nr:YbhB/YbcL family Raf kinase inhibitor-like protein [Pyrinomonadaceae bacterium MAG19_C2-C3]
MIKSINSVFACLLALAVTASLSNAQTQKTATTVPIEAHVYETAKLEATAARLAGLRLPAGFRIARFAELTNPRMIAVAPDNTIYVTQREPGTLVMLRDTNNDGIADVQKVVAKREHLHGLALHKNRMYLVTINGVLVADVRPDGTLGALRTIITDLPDAGQHPNRTLAVGTDEKLYITIGSTCNNCRESETKPELATIVRANLDGTNRKVFASGLRNTIGFGWHPVSKRLFGMDHGIDWLGDDDQPEELNELIVNTKYGYPYVYANSKIYPHGEAPKGFTKESWARMSREPALLYTAHSSPLQMTFYTGNMFPAEYKNDALVAMRGSWNRQPPSGYEVVRVRFDASGNPQRIEPFITGFLIKGGAPDGKDAHIARLAGLAQMNDGSLLLGDDTNNVIYRITYEQAAGQAIKSNADAKMIVSRMPEMQAVPSSITIRSNAFTNNQPIPEPHSAYNQDSSPALEWSGVPRAAKSVVIVMEDPDAGNTRPVTHWLIANLPANATTLPARVPVGERIANLSGAMQGANNLSTSGYYGPKPPAGDTSHHYHFQVFALDRVLQLPSGFNRQALLDAMRTHVIAKGEIVGTYQRR